jgi:hypothetical protein
MSSGITVNCSSASRSWFYPSLAYLCPPPYQAQSFDFGLCSIKRYDYQRKNRDLYRQY